MILTHLALMGFFSGVGAQQVATTLVATKRYTLLLPATGRPLRNMPPIDVGVPQTIAIDCGLFLPPGVTLIGTPSVSISVVSGTDSSPDSRLDGVAQVGTASIAVGGTGLANVTMLQQLTLAAANYLVHMTCGRSDGTDEVSAPFHVYGNTPA